MKQAILICLCVSTLVLFPCASLAEITGTPPNAAGDTVINEDTVWRGQNIVLGRNLTVNSGKSLTIDACDVLFNAVWPDGKMTSQTGTTIVIKNSYVHGQDEVNRATGIVLGGGNNTLTVKISGTAFKYIGPSSSWTKYMGSTADGYGVPMISAKAIYTTDSYFRGNSLICDSIPARPNNTPGNWVWGFLGPGDGANQTPAHGLKIENCYLARFYCGDLYGKYLSGSTLRLNAFPIYVPPHHFVHDGNWMQDNLYKSYDLFNGSHHGLVKDSYLQNTCICLADWPGAAHNVFQNNIMISVLSEGIREGSAGGGTGDDNIFIGNEFIGFYKSLFMAGKDWVLAGNRVTGVNDSFGFGMQAYPDGGDPSIPDGAGRSKLDNAERGTVIIGNVIKNAASVDAGISVGKTRVWGGGANDYWKDVVIAGNRITNCTSRGLRISNVNRAVVKNNTISENGIGLEISADATQYNIVNNDISDNNTNVVGTIVNSEDFPDATIVSPETNQFQAGQPVTFQGAGVAKGGKTIVSYWWFFGDGAMSNEQNPTHTFAKDGEYFVALLVTDSDGLRDIAIMDGRIEAVWNQEDPKRPWPGREPRLAAYPNPLFIACGSPITFVHYFYRGETNLRIEDAAGRLVREIADFGGLTDWDLKDSAGEQVSPGKYLAITLDGDGEVARCSFTITVASDVEIKGRHVFYNRSAFDGNNLAANAADDGAVAPDKTALLPGGTATFANYTSYSRGINGIMIDIAGLPGTPTAADFIFKVGNDNTTGLWGDAPAPTSITVREDAGIDGSDRITIIWADNAIQKQWLQVTVKATDATGLASGDVFYFGNAIGETGDSITNAIVGPTDGIGARNHPHSPPNPTDIEDVYDFDRNTLVTPTDEILTRNNATNPITTLNLIIVP